MSPKKINQSYHNLCDPSVMLYILYDYFSPAYRAGGPIQSLVNLVHLLKDDVQVKVICSKKDLDGSELNVPENRWINYHHALVYYSDKGFNHFRRSIEKGNHTYFINGMFSYQFNFLPALFLKGRKIISVRGMLHAEALAQKSIKKSLYLWLWKFLGLHKKCEYHSTSEKETHYIQNKFGADTKVWTISNLPNLMEWQPSPPKNKGQLILASIALISPMKNHLLVLESLKLCTHSVTYNIYGPVKDNAYWARCKNVIANLPSNVTVNYCGEISPDEVEGVLAETHVVIQPSKSENFGHSLLEALVSGRPLITSQHTPWNFLEENCAGKNVCINNTIEMIDAIDHFATMGEPELLDWSKHARVYALSAIDIEKLKAQYLQMFAAN